MCIIWKVCLVSILSWFCNVPEKRKKKKKQNEPGLLFVLLSSVLLDCDHFLGNWKNHDLLDWTALPWIWALVYLKGHLRDSYYSIINDNQTCISLSVLLHKEQKKVQYSKKKKNVMKCIIKKEKVMFCFKSALKLHIFVISIVLLYYLCFNYPKIVCCLIKVN